MASNLVSIDDLGAIGIIQDRPAHTLPANAFTDGLNIRFLDGAAERFRNQRDAFVSLEINPPLPGIQALYGWEDLNGTRYWEYAGGSFFGHFSEQMEISLRGSTLNQQVARTWQDGEIEWTALSGGVIPINILRPTTEVTFVFQVSVTERPQVGQIGLPLREIVPPYKLRLLLVAVENPSIALETSAELTIDAFAIPQELQFTLDLTGYLGSQFRLVLQGEFEASLLNVWAATVRGTELWSDYVGAVQACAFDAESVLVRQGSLSIGLHHFEKNGLGWTENANYIATTLNGERPLLEGVSVMSSTRVEMGLSIFDYDGSDFTFVSRMSGITNPFGGPNFGSGRSCALNSTDIAVFSAAASNSDPLTFTLHLTTVRYDGSWSKIGNSFLFDDGDYLFPANLTAISQCAIVKVSASRIALLTVMPTVTTPYHRLFMMEFDGTDWSIVGNFADFPRAGSSINSSLALIGSGEGYLDFLIMATGTLAIPRVVRFDGTDWTTVATDVLNLNNIDAGIQRHLYHFGDNQALLTAGGSSRSLTLLGYGEEHVKIKDPSGTILSNFTGIVATQIDQVINTQELYVKLVSTLTGNYIAFNVFTDGDYDTPAEHGLAPGTQIYIDAYATGLPNFQTAEIIINEDDGTTTVLDYLPAGFYEVFDSQDAHSANPEQLVINVRGTLLEGTGDADSGHTIFAGTVPNNGRWSIADFNGTIIKNNSLSSPNIPYDSENSWGDLEVSAQTIRAFGNFLVALDVTNPPGLTAGRYSRMVKWSASAPPNSLPSWDETDLGLDAGEIELAETSEPVIDCLPMGDLNVIYKYNSCYGMQYIGPPFIFRFFTMFKDLGVLGPNCVVEWEGKHIVLTNGDIVMHDGQQVQSLLDGGLRQWLFANIDLEFARNAFVTKHVAQNEIWFCIPTRNNRFASTAIIWNWRTNTTSLRELPHVGTAASIFALGNPDLFNPIQPAMVMAVGPNARGGEYGHLFHPDFNGVPNPAIMVADVLQTNDPTPINAFLERRSLPYVGQDQQGNPIADLKSIKRITRVYPKVEIVGEIDEATNVFRISVGAHDRIGSTVQWSEPKIFNLGMRYVDFPEAPAGQLVAYRIDCGVPRRWRLFGMDLEVSQVGKI